MKLTEGRTIPFFPGVTGKILLWTERLMFFLVEIEVGGVVPEHSHPHEQMGLCLQGEAEFWSAGERTVVQAGMTYSISANEPHSVKVIGTERGVFIDVFSPPREDYLSKLGKMRPLKND